jgi:hypothetical protein
MTERFETFAWTNSAMCSGGEKILEKWMWQLKLANPRRSAKLLGQCFSVPFALHDHCTRMTLCTNREV